MLHACLCTICFVFYYTSWHFYAFSGTNLLPRCHSASSLFSAVFVLQKSYIGNILGIRRNKSRSSYFSRYEMESKAETEGDQGQPHHRVARLALGPCHQVVGPPGPPPDAALPPIYSPRRGKPKDPINFLWSILQAAAIVDARSGGSRSSSRHPAGEGNHHRRPSSSPCMPPKWCVSSLPWTTGP
jgi:hypothetical protein